jgi:hypothetical protein
MSNLSLERMLFDPNDPTVGPKVGSYIIASDGSIITDTSGALDVNIANSSIDVTQSGTWAVQITDGSETLAIDTNGYITANINGTVTVSGAVTTDFLPNILPLSQAISVTDTEVALPTSPLTNRKRLQIQNVGSEPIYIGKTGVLTTSGLMIPKGATESLEAGPTAAYFGIAPSGKTVPVRILEF